MITRSISPLRPWGRRGQGEVGDFRGAAEAHLTLLSRRDGPLPLPPMGGEGDLEIAETSQ